MIIDVFLEISLLARSSPKTLLCAYRADYTVAAGRGGGWSGDDIVVGLISSSSSVRPSAAPQRQYSEVVFAIITRGFRTDFSITILLIYIYFFFSSASRENGRNVTLLPPSYRIREQRDRRSRTPPTAAQWSRSVADKSSRDNVLRLRSGSGTARARGERDRRNKSERRGTRRDRDGYAVCGGVQLSGNRLIAVRKRLIARKTRIDKSVSHERRPSDSGRISI